MTTNQFKIVGAVAIILIFLSGFRLSRVGKPYGNGLFTIHKLIALAAVVSFVLLLRQVHLADGLGGVELVLGIAAGVFVVGLFATGAVMSIVDVPPAVVKSVHHVLPYLGVGSVVVNIYLLR